MTMDFLGSDRALIIGLMSGTSADGIDAALVEVWDDGGGIRWRLVSHAAVSWPDAIRAAILDACCAEAPVQHVTALNFLLGREFARAAIQAAREADVAIDQVAAIASHGQTVWHQPTPFGVGGSEAVGTLQIGEPAVIAAQTGRIVVADFRVADMAVGGHGAPLVPFADAILFGSDDETRAVQNLGGIANVTLLPLGRGPADLLAFDTGPGNLVIDAMAERVSGGMTRIDRDGTLAAAGTPDVELVDEWLRDPYFSKNPPKSTGREMFGAEYADMVYAAAQSRALSAADLLATVTALTVESIRDAYHRFLLPRCAVDSVILGGGGTRNPVLVAGLRHRLSPAKVLTHADFGIPNEAKEAIAFALLGYSTLRGRPSNVPVATGARRAAVLGKIVLPPCAA